MINKSIEGKENNINVEAKINGTLNICIVGNNNTIRVGKDVIVKSKLDLNIHCNDASITIGNNSSFEDTAIGLFEDGTHVTIGEDCMFAMGTTILASDFHSIIDLSNGKRTNFAKDVVLGNHVWVASRTMILKNSVIGDNSILAAGAIVSGRFPSNSVIGGNPCKVIKNNVYWSRTCFNKNIDYDFNIKKLEYADITFNIEKKLSLKNIELHGWAFLPDVDNRILNKKIMVIDKKNKKHYYECYNHNSFDVAEHFKSDFYSKVRFASVIGINKEDIKSITLCIYSNDIVKGIVLNDAIE